MTGLNNWSKIVISKVEKFWGRISLNTILDIGTWMIVPNAVVIGTVNKMLFGTLYLLLIKLQVNIKLSTGEITGVEVERYWTLVDWTVGGYVPNVKPIRFPNGCPNDNDGVWGDTGYVQVAFAGLVYPKLVAWASVGME